MTERGEIWVRGWKVKQDNQMNFCYGFSMVHWHIYSLSCVMSHYSIYFLSLQYDYDFRLLLKSDFYVFYPKYCDKCTHDLHYKVRSTNTKQKEAYSHEEIKILYEIWTYTFYTCALIILLIVLSSLSLWRPISFRWLLKQWFWLIMNA